MVSHSNLDLDQNNILSEFGGEFTGAKDFPIKKKSKSSNLGVFNDSEHSGSSHVKDPFDLLGSGMQAYFKMLRILTVMFLFFSALMVPAMMIYKSEDGLAGTLNYDAVKYTLGNMGFSSSHCISQYTNLNRPRTLSCTTGKMTQLKYSGIIPNTLTSYDKDGTNPFAYAFCGDPLSSEVPGVTECLAYLQ